ncbi:MULTISPECIES: type II restriction endonuclease [Enterobacterales]|nr:type II restriction endonuclease [Klebsiella variicola]MCU6213200.1 type II restriction endonuclease [Morganella morganii]MCU6233555.1 type II restriction endonuclease [Morganella morganii]HAT1515139.1 restriction endonuclease [Morganella morganii]HAT1528819.1 restriction endonuclease [Morganella morganii]HDF2365840.1 restriction endonuclease [Morganella morganii]
MSEFQDWLTNKSTDNYFLYIKRLSANDTGATGGHQAGLYIPSGIVTELFPSINHTREQNPSVLLRACYFSHSCADTEARAIYYNNRFFGKTRNEKRITRWGPKSPLQDPENTGALAILAFKHTPGNDSNSADVWVCNTPDEEDIIEATLGEIIPGTLLFGPGKEILGGLALQPKVTKKNYKIPGAWKTEFPSGTDIIQYAAGYFSAHCSDPDEQLLDRRRIEYDIFLLVEEMHVLDIIRKGFGSVDEFIAMANSVSNRRKSRAGRSLELHLEQLFLEYGLTHFATQCITEGNKKPDFIFPSADAYHDVTFPDNNLHMLAVKTTCKDRWRQVLNEADRIKSIHLFTLQEGVSPAQFREMKQAGITLVVPSALHKKYPDAIRSELMSLGGFIAKLTEIYTN